MPQIMRYPLDPSGESPDNYVSGEVHTLSNNVVRVLIPKYGPFYTKKNFSLYDHATQRILVKDVDWKLPSILQEATIDMQSEVADSILIINTQISDQVRVNYQAVGGLYQNTMENTVAMYEAVMNDSRNVDWVDGIINKPIAYPPGPHPTWLNDIQGWGPIIMQLERMVQAILLGNAPGYEAIYQSLLRSTATDEDIEEGQRVEKWLTLRGLIHALDKYNFNTIEMVPDRTNLSNGRSLWVDVKATHIPHYETWYWTIKHIDTDDEDFIATSGILNMVNGRGRFMVQASFNKDLEESEEFQIELRRSGTNGMILAISQPMTMLHHTEYARDSLLPAIITPTLSTPRLKRSAKVYAANMTIWGHHY